MSTIAFKLTRVAVTGVLAGGLAAALVLPAGDARSPVRQLPTDFWSAFALAASDGANLYLSVNGFVGGGSTSAAHPRVSTASSVDSGVTNNGITKGGGGGTGKTTPEQIVITKPIDAYTVQFDRAASQLRRISGLQIFLTREGSDTSPLDVFEIDASNVVVTSDSVRVEQGGSAVETVKVNFTQLTWTVRTRDEQGGVRSASYCFDFAASRTCPPT